MPNSAFVLGLLWSFLTVLAWSGYNLAAVVAIERGFTSVDLSILRFGVSGLLLLPAGLWFFGNDLRRIGAARLFLLSLLGGPLFGVVATAGYYFAPLSHGLVFAPAAVLGIGQVWGRLLGLSGFTPQQWIGVLILLAGLAVLSGFDLADIGPQVLLGDFIFILAGIMWGSFTFLIGYWRLDPAPVTCGVGGFALLQVALYVVLARPELPPVSTAEIAFQAVIQGAVGGGLAALTFALAIRALGGAKASALPSFTPVMGFMLAFLFLDELPDLAEFAGSLIASTGLLVILTSRSGPASDVRPGE